MHGTLFFQVMQHFFTNVQFLTTARSGCKLLIGHHSKSHMHVAIVEDDNICCFASGMEEVARAALQPWSNSLETNVIAIGRPEEGCGPPTITSNIVGQYGYTPLSQRKGL